MTKVTDNCQKLPIPAQAPLQSFAAIATPAFDPILSFTLIQEVL